MHTIPFVVYPPRAGGSPNVKNECRGDCQSKLCRMKLSFGTDGWRGVIADEFTFANVGRVARA
ncbi:hypothetical protein, partial [Deinococcus sp. 12RED42]|uniref:hypothetical protein n=1 Tax=Deinococcus sp. 12RED42 TaxID=2745872 RepID=UPI001E5490ED